MSFRSNNEQRRYGHVPPAQYAPPGGQDPNRPVQQLQRQSSFDNGDDSGFFDPNYNPYMQQQTPTQPPALPPRQQQNWQQGNQYNQYPPANSNPPQQQSYGNQGSAFSGYQHQYQPAQQTPVQQAPYNPQNFVRTQSQSNPAPYQPLQNQYQNNAPAQSPYTNNNSGYAHQPYNPAAYQPPQQQPYRQTSSAGYNNLNPSYQSPQPPTPQSGGGYWSQGGQQQQFAPPTPARPSPQPAYDSYAAANPQPPPQPPRQPAYTVPAASTYPTNGQNYNQSEYRTPAAAQAPYPTYGSTYTSLPVAPAHENQYQEQTSFATRVRASSIASNQTSPPTAAANTASPVVTLGRHPTLRPLPSAPVESKGDDDDWAVFGATPVGKSREEMEQDRIFADIGDALGNSRQTNGDLLDGELNRFNSTASTMASTMASGTDHSHASTATSLAAGETPYSYDEDESDLEAAAGLEAMRIAEEEDAQGGRAGSIGYMPYESEKYGAHQHPPLEESSDSDYKHMDLGLASGGYDAPFTYHADGTGGNTGHSSEMEDQSRPLPSASALGRSGSNSHVPPAGLGGMTDYSLPYDSIHPFPSFDNNAARVDTFGTGGLQRPTSHRLSFDEGDEQVSIHSRLSESRQSGRSGDESPIRDDMMPELFYHPGMSQAASYQRPLPLVPPMSENVTPQLQAAGAYRNQSYPSHSYTSSFDSQQGFVPSGPDAYPSQGMLSPTGQYVPRSTSLSSHSNTPQTVPPVRSKTDAERQKAARARPSSGSVVGGPIVGGLDGYEMATPQSAMTLDLPALPAGGRRKKYHPGRLATVDYRKCSEPWALSGLAAWIREMAGGETGEGEQDLRQKAIEEGLVALFTHKVPTMNTADAETLSQRVTKSMLDAGILIPDEEWVKFGQGQISGVLWQLTGSGCYSPKVHEQEIHGRCYSHHCTRTLKKINLQAQKLEPSRKLEDWATFFKITKEQVEGVHRKEVERQNNLHEIVMSEDIYMDQVNVLRILYRDELASWQPPIIAKAKLPKFLVAVFGKIEAIKDVNENHLLPQLKYRQKEQGPWVIGFSDIFREWIRKARTAYVEYASGFPYASYLVRREADRNILFQQFLDQARDNKLSGRLGWDTYLKAPITRLQRYSLLLGTVLHNMTQDTEEKANLAVAIEEIKAVTLECDAKVEEQTKKVEMVELQSKLFLRPGMERVELNLDHLGRQLIFQGDLQRAGANRFTWLETHAILFDHYLVLAKTVVKSEGASGRKKEVYDVSKLPIPMQLLVLESTNDDPVVKSTVKGLGAVTTVTKTAPSTSTDARLSRISTNATERSGSLEQTNSSNSIMTVSSARANSTPGYDADARSMYPFKVKHLGKTETYTLYAPTSQSRQEWCEKILDAKTLYAASLYEQNAEPFRLEILADTAFAYDAVSSGIQRSPVAVEGTPVDRAIRHMEKIYGAGPRPGPVCRAMVNCASAFTCYGKSMIAIGTDYGVYTSEASNPRGWTRAVQMSRVTQIAVLEEFSLCLIVADKALIAYHLDVIVPVSSFPAPTGDSNRRAPQKLSGNRDVSFFATARMKDRTLVFYKKREGLHSTFKVLEPVFQKSSEKKSRLFGKRFGGTAEFFREFDEFYIPTECFTVNLFHSYIAISTLKGFELMTLDKKVAMSIPDTKNPAIASIAARLNGQKPLGMFRLSEAEFLLCYEECGVYVDKHGDVSRSVIMEFVGKAKSAALYGAYLVLFDSDFVEVRNAENGRLRQVISGRDIRCLDYGVNPLGAGAPRDSMNGSRAADEKRTIKLAMAHPEISGSQIVLEMLLNEGHSE